MKIDHGGAVSCKLCAPSATIATATFATVLASVHDVAPVRSDGRDWSEVNLKVWTGEMSAAELVALVEDKVLQTTGAKRHASRIALMFEDPGQPDGRVLFHVVEDGDWFLRERDATP